MNARWGWILVPVALGLWLGPKLKDQSSYVLIEWNLYSIETTVPFLILLLLLALILLLALLRVLGLLQHTGSQLWNWRSRHQRSRRDRELSEATLLALNGQFKTAQKRFGKAAISGDQLAWVACLAAAWSAEQQADSAQRDLWLVKALVEQPDAEIPLRLLQAQWLQSSQPEQAWQLLNALSVPASQRPVFEQLWYPLALQRGESDAVLQALDSSSLSAEQRHYWQEQAERQRLQRLIERSAHPDELRVGWHNLPDRLQKPELLAQIVRGLWRLDAVADAEQLLSSHLAQHWDEALVDLYGRCRMPDASAMQQQTERWLKRHADSPALWRTLGRLSARQQQWAQAREQLQQSLKLADSADSWALLAQVALQLQDRQLADQSYHQALALVVQERAQHA